MDELSSLYTKDLSESESEGFLQTQSKGDVKTGDPLKQDLFQVVKRTRAVLSTFSTSSHADRSLKALSVFTQAKLLKRFYL